MTRGTTNHRLVALCAGFLAAFGILWLRCAWLQAIDGPRLAGQARAQHWVSQMLLAKRGMVTDRHGAVLAMSARAPSVFANPRQVAAKEYVAARLARLLDRDPGVLQARLARDKGFVWVARHMEPRAVGEELRPFLRQGVGLMEEPHRLYPSQEMAGHLLGYVDIDERGLEGLELSLNGLLRGRHGRRSTLRDARGDLLIGPWTVEVQPEPGHDVVLTIDRVVQGVAEEALAWGVKKFHAKGGSLIVMDPRTGGLLAAANQPAFNPNHPGEAPAASRRNRAITDLFEPGSIFKVVTAAALIEEGLVSPEERFFCEQGAYPTVARHVLHDHTGHGWLTFHDVITYSSNIGTAKAAQRLKPDVLYRYIRAFGFGRKTGLELPGEVSGIIAPPSRWSKLSPYIIPIGQEVAVTPIQLAVMTAAIANGGWRVRPYLIDRIQRPDGSIVRTSDPSRDMVLRSETADTVTDMLVSAVESGTGRLARIQGLTVAGKTGTAQKLEPNGRYSHSRYVASFVGYGPVPDSRFVVVVTVDEPRPLYFGGVVAAPIFRRVVEHLRGYWELDAPAGLFAKAN